MIRIGFHLSIAGSVVNAPRVALESGFTAFQMFVSSSRSWKSSKIDGNEAKEFMSIVEQNDIVPNAHIPYLCNPSSTNPEMYRKSIDMLLDNMRNCEQLGVPDLVIHIGSHLGKGLEHGLKNSCEAIKKGLEGGKHVNILLENTSGYNNSVGSRFEEIGHIIDNVGSNRVGVCLDTCHAFAAGYDLRTKESIARTAEEFDNAIGLKRLRLVHLNDSKYELGKHLDRHWHIGKGFIGREGFVEFFRSRAFGNGRYILETPVNHEGNEATNYETTLEIIRLAEAKR